jgi:hypothetical protein
MSEDLLRQVLEQSAFSAPPVKAAALLHIARVLIAFDRQRAVHVLDEALSLARTLPEADQHIILGEAVFLAASVDPERAMDLLHEGLTNVPHPRPLANLIRVMLDHGYSENAIGYLMGPIKAGEFPFSIVGNVIEKCPDDATRLRVFRVAARSWIQRPIPEKGHPMDHGFLQLFSSRWRSLPLDEATVLTHQIVATIRRNPDKATHARIGSENGVAFTSYQEYELFLLLNVLRELIPDTLVHRTNSSL